MKRLICGTIVFIVVGCKHAEVKPEKRLSDGCAIASLLALKAIQGDPLVPEPHSNLVSRNTQEKIDAADVAAVTMEERRVAGALNVVYHARLFQNKQTSRLQSLQKLAGHSGETAGMRTEQEATDKEVSDFEASLSGCSRDFDESLRARSLSVPRACEELPQAEDMQEAAWQEVKAKLAREAAARRQEQALAQKRDSDLALCEKNDRLLGHSGNFHGLDQAGQRRLHLACEDVRSGKRHDLGTEFD